MHDTHATRGPCAPSGRRRLVCLLGALSLAAAAASSSHAQAAAARAATISDIWQGVFSAQQAERGAAVFDEHCAECHDADRRGEAPALSGDAFRRSWEGHSAARLYDKILELMPPGDPQRVAPRQKLDVLAFILRENGFPAGAAELAADGETLAHIRLLPPGGPAALRSGAVVQAVGCLARASTGGWVLARATEPEATTLNAGAASADAGRLRPLGAQTIDLLAVFPSPDALAGHRVEAKGLLVRTEARVAINVVTLRSLAAACP